MTSVQVWEFVLIVIVVQGKMQQQLTNWAVL
ncbi:twice split molybdate metabolism regulator domain protein [Escherichia coli]|nr:twice split molybdate metabolism regulator domain protein [Escherichia coli]EFB2755305.1 twice split molybdate metabolism regulator domain protein [Escherichia coli]EFN7845702.1 twice split molybdate metabolism regulator domain protein [Escherichia coli]EGD5027696.1 twice split molybdate metabolism regulator domain protein [Escherichia coli]TNR10461.1 twice split molybdate metabolism regulator domain protein [Escherichia coli]